MTRHQKNTTHISTALLAIATMLAGCALEDDPWGVATSAVFSDSDQRPPDEDFEPISTTQGFNAHSDATGDARYPETVVDHERIGVNGTAAKEVVFNLHAQTANQGFRITLHSTSDNKATVTLVSSPEAGDPTTVTSCTHGTDCVAPMGHKSVILRVKGRGQGKHWFATYSSVYLQECDASVGRYCNEVRQYHNAWAKFSRANGSENDLFQGNVRLFDVQVGDFATVRFTSDKSFANIPDLRVMANDATGSKVRLGHTYPCTPADMIGTDHHYFCEIPSTDAVPDTAGYTDVRLELASRRNSGGATFKMWNVTRTRTSLP